MTRSSVRDDIATFPVIIDIDVAWGEMDAYGHVNNAAFFRYFESARMTFLRAIRFVTPADNGGVGPILASTECVFRRPLTYPDTIRVGARPFDIGTDRFNMEYQVFSTQLNTIAAFGSGIVVAYDYRANSKAVLPPMVREQIIKLADGDAGSRR